VGVDLHPIFRRQWSLAVVDEVHFHRSPTSEWTLSQSYLSKRSKRRIGLSATPVVNRPLDLAGICTALNAPDYLQSAVSD
jgi:superfamily II DNA or RNA helicase